MGARRRSIGTILSPIPKLGGAGGFACQRGSRHNAAEELPPDVFAFCPLKRQKMPGSGLPLRRFRVTASVTDERQVSAPRFSAVAGERAAPGRLKSHGLRRPARWLLTSRVFFLYYMYYE